MEPEEVVLSKQRDTHIELQQWQKEILEKECFDLKPQQKKMIEELLYPSDSNPYWVETEYRLILKRVLKWGYYREGDREALNYARECYLRGNNWIK
jgi:hypothetical protein